HGFDPQVAGNDLRFNGTPASILSATPQALIAIVPDGATTGPLTLHSQGRTAVSASPFVIDASLRPPAIHNVSPLIASQGTTVTVSGEWFRPVPAQTTATLGLRPVPPASITDTEIQFPIPTNAASGKVGVRTPLGTALSAQDIIVVPAPIDPSTVRQAKRIVVDGPSDSFETASTSEYAAALFDANAGDYLSANFADLTASISYTLYSPSNQQVASGTISPSNRTILFPRLSSIGTHLLMMRPTAGSAAWTLNVERAKTVGINSDSQDLAAGSAQQLRLTIPAPAGDRLGLGISDLAVSSGSYVSVQVLGPTGAHVTSVTCYQAQGGCGLNISAGTTGTYSVVVTPQSSTQTMSFRTTVSSDVVGELVRDSAMALTLPRRGQNARLAFNATAGETLALQVAGQTTVPANRNSYYYVYRPNGSLLTSMQTSSGSTLNLPNLPETGQYLVLVDPNFGETLTSALTLIKK
ncbi:IPT/TIG domain-containing protein, partial [Luteimonas fraxinea]|uniref:IPT/TIG domain-containing protein n=1 Tax=Luteimonas fraxinea TaxID=2901869 RepID=UPI002E1488AC|nr:hypothetical protein [Luteimonas fraxinea]